MNSFSSDVAPLKFVPLSEYMLDGEPRLPTNVLNASMKVSVSQSLTISKWTHLMVKQENKHAHLQLLPTLLDIDGAK